MSLLPPTSRLWWNPAYRIVSSRFPPVSVFDAVTDPADLEAVFRIEGLTNPRLRQELGQIDLVPKERRISGPGTTPIMAAFTHANPDGSRFSPGGFGVYYASRQRDTAIRETVHHRQIFLAATAEPPCRIEMRCYTSIVRGTVDDLRGGWPELHAADSYAASQRFGAARRESGSDGIVYDSVRHAGGECVAVFYPDLVSPCLQEAHLYYGWNGQRIDRVVVAGEILEF